jgi:hypothetical protein
MRLKDLMNEMSLQAYNTVGFDKNKKGEIPSGGFDKIDRKLVTNDVFKTKLTKFFEKTPHPFYIYTIQKSGLAKNYSEHGIMKLEDVNALISTDIATMIDEYQQEDPDGIHIIFVGNSGANKEIMKPWIMAHRIGHAIIRNDGGGFVSDKNILRQMSKVLFKEINSALTDHYGVDLQQHMKRSYTDKLDSMFFSPDAAKIYSSLFHSIGTMKSARDEKIPRPFEFVYEIFAQYILTGKVTFNKFPASIQLKTPSGRINKQFTAHDEEDEIYASEMESLAEHLSERLSEQCENVLMSIEGKIFVM